ncbi:unnamed protein product [Pleuronectes platessa]|uniref:Uncharacterized protein n=1 Tax=Pleuronectes platessa TaxID=8262 RepID=A0A9N7VU71_PLEPL|nr:unnamed protein product [Pleuronectes platessa]
MINELSTAWRPAQADQYSTDERRAGVGGGGRGRTPTSLQAWRTDMNYFGMLGLRVDPDGVEECEKIHITNGFRKAGLLRDGEETPPHLRLSEATLKMRTFVVLVRRKKTKMRINDLTFLVTAMYLHKYEEEGYVIENGPEQSMQISRSRSPSSKPHRCSEARSTKSLAMTTGQQQRVGDEASKHLFSTLRDKPDWKRGEEKARGGRQWPGMGGLESETQDEGSKRDALNLPGARGAKAVCAGEQRVHLSGAQHSTGHMGPPERWEPSEAKPTDF